MARARNIKPGFFINEELVALPFATRLLFIGLWTLADREGRLEDRPLRIKMAVFPADDLDVNAALAELEAAKLLTRYVADNERFIQITNFVKHQKPHQNESESVIPEPPGLAKKAEALAPLVEAVGPSSLNPSSLNDECGMLKESANADKRPLSADFQITDGMREWAKAKVPSVDVDDELEEFIGYWHNIDGNKTKRTTAGWVQTWQNRMKDLEKRTKAKPPRPKPSGEAEMFARDHEPAAVSFGLAIDLADGEGKMNTRDDYLELKEYFLEHCADRAHQIDEYERGYEYRQRFAETGQIGNSRSPTPGGGNGHGTTATQMPVPR